MKQSDRIERMLEFIILESHLRDISEYLDRIPQWRHVNERGADESEALEMLKRSVISVARDRVWEANKENIRVFGWLRDIGMRVINIVYDKEEITSDQLAKEILGKESPPNKVEENMD